ncbi:MAG: C40 family peptidase [Pseudomonadota bacterium]|nr:C40 family peptidase [Pseudomonadota bacterium]
MTGEEVVRRARALIGVRFRPQGRSRDTGVDCIGLVAVALEREDVRQDYRLRGGCQAELERGLEASGMRQADGLAAGCVVVMRPGPEQLHLGIWSGSGLIHADAGLGRVVERPGAPPWPVLGRWRMEV